MRIHGSVFYVLVLGAGCSLGHIGDSDSTGTDPAAGPQNAPPTVAEKPEERAVIGSDLDDQAVCRRREAADHVVGVLLEVAHKRRRRPRNVNVVLVKYLGVDDVEELDMAAGSAEPDVERKPRLPGGELFARDERVGKGYRCERQDLVQPAGPAQAAAAAAPAGYFRCGHDYLFSGGMRTTSAS